MRPIYKLTDLLPVLNRGKFSERCDEHLRHAIDKLEALPDGQGKATITLAITVAYQDGRLEVVPSVKSKLPEDKGFSGTPFWSVEGGFSVQHPSQSDFFGGPRSVEDGQRDRA